MNFEIREYRPEDAQEWMRVHAIIMTLSHAWNYCIQERPEYVDYTSTRLVATLNGDIVGLTDCQYDNQPGELCYLRDSLGGYVCEFGRLPEVSGCNLGKRLIDATVEDARRKGFGRLEYWSQDRKAQRFYQRLGMKEIGRHYRFRMKPLGTMNDLLVGEQIGIEYVYAVCLPEDWPVVQQKYEIIDKHPLEPHLCIGYEIRF
ncbi:MAG TPA: GNAT family N-acetyltransferase [Candidatus Hydrogenedentes bacterium]|nr:GNAT family N-acetyltransferase [Candidatus Hydrogenedentota bacterium]